MGIHSGHREKMRTRFLGSGLDSFAEHEALELLLFYAIPRRDTNPTAHALMDRFGTLANVFSASVDDLQSVEGIGESAAILIRLVSLLHQKAAMPSGRRPVIISSTEAAGKYLLHHFASEHSEAAYELCLDRKGKLLACKRLGSGSDISVNLDIRQLVENAIRSSASAVVLAHNHPSGVALPSPSDYAATERIKTALDALGIDLADHIIVADGDFVSLRESGFLQ